MINVLKKFNLILKLSIVEDLAGIVAIFGILVFSLTFSSLF